MSQLLNLLRRDERGTGTIELALSAPILAFLLVGAADMGMGYSERLALQQAANRTLEMGMSLGMQNDSYSYLQAIGATNSGQSTSNVTIDNWLECDGTRANAFDGTCGSNQQTARYISVRITGTHEPLFYYNGLARRFGDTGLGGSVAITGKSVVRIQ